MYSNFARFTERSGNGQRFFQNELCRNNRRSKNIMIVVTLLLLLFASTGCGETTAVRTDQASDLYSLVSAFEDSIRVDPIWPGFSGYCGWNYECATMVYALKFNLDLELGLFGTTKSDINEFLKAATKFPHPGFWPNFAFWMFTPGDRIGLFGSLYHFFRADSVKSDQIVNVVNSRLKEWSKPRGVYARNFGWGFLYDINIFPLNLWIDDSFMGGVPLLHSEDVNAYGQLLLSYHNVFRDSVDGLYWHGLKLELFSDRASNNGVKWGRGNGWLLLSMAVFLLETKDNPNITSKQDVLNNLKLQINTLVSFQRESGAFGNVVNDADSADETSLASVYVFAAAILNLYNALDNEALEAAEKAWGFLKTRTTNPSRLELSDTSAGQALSNNPSDYGNNVGMSDGPGAAFVLYAIIGKELLDRNCRYWSSTLIENFEPPPKC